MKFVILFKWLRIVVGVNMNESLNLLADMNGWQTHHNCQHSLLDICSVCLLTRWFCSYHTRTSYRLFTEFSVTVITWLNHQCLHLFMFLYNNLHLLCFRLTSFKIFHFVWQHKDLFMDVETSSPAYWCTNSVAAERLMLHQSIHWLGFSVGI